MRQSFVVYDEFLPNPEAFLERAQSLPFRRSGMIPGNLATGRVSWASRMERRCEQLLGRKVTWARKLGSGTYRWTSAREASARGTEFYSHSDGIYDVVCLLYLSPERHCHGGTGFFRHKKTGLSGYHDLAPVQRVMDREGTSVLALDTEILKDAYDRDAWDMTDLVEMRSNRLVIYNSRRFHSHVFDFAAVPKGSKRWTFACFGRSD